MIDISRRGMVGGMGAMGLMGMMGAGTAFAEGGFNDGVTNNGAGLSTSDVDYATAGQDCPWSGPGSEAGDWNGTPDEIKALGGCTMPLAELNRRRKMYLDAQGDYTCADGTVIPAVYVKVVCLLNTYSYGVGSVREDDDFAYAMSELTEEEAQAFLDMPYGQQFSAYEFYAESNYSYEDAQRLCESLAGKAWINRTVNDRGTLYFQVPLVQGNLEYHDPDWWRGTTDFSEIRTVNGPDVNAVGFGMAGACFFGPSPVSPEVVKDGEIYPFDDLLEVWKTKNRFSLSPCTCRLISCYSNGVELPGFPDGDYDLSDVVSPTCGHDLLTCLSCGEEAQFWIDHGVGHEITYEEAVSVLKKSVEDGLILQRIQSKEAETICSCHGDCCGILGRWKALGSPEALEESETFKHIIRYSLDVDLDSCVKCGTCADRCPMAAITMDGEDGTPRVSGMCFRCGQCAYTCPTGSRVLVPLPEEQVRPFSKDIIELNNMMAAQRFEAGLIW